MPVPLHLVTCTLIWAGVTERWTLADGRAILNKGLSVAHRNLGLYPGDRATI